MPRKSKRKRLIQEIEQCLTIQLDIVANDRGLEENREHDINLLHLLMLQLIMLHENRYVETRNFTRRNCAITKYIRDYSFDDYMRIRAHVMQEEKPLLTFYLVVMTNCNILVPRVSFSLSCVSCFPSWRLCTMAGKCAGFSPNFEVFECRFRSSTFFLNVRTYIQRKILANQIAFFFLHSNLHSRVSTTIDWKRYWMARMGSF